MASLTRPDAVLFDFGDTLVATTPMDVAAGTAAVLATARNGSDVTVEQVIEAGHRLIPLPDLRRRIRDSALEFPTSCFQLLLYERLGISFDEPPIAQEQAFWRGAYGPMLPTPGIARFLDMLRQQGIKTAVVSNASFRGETIEAELVRAGLRDRLGFVMSSADYGLRKPDPAMLEVALARLGVTADRAWFCGDRLDWDAAAARAAGTVAVWYAPEGEEPGEPRPDVVLRHWDEATAIVVGRSEAP